MIPQITNVQGQEINTYREPDKTYKINAKTITKLDDKKEAVRQAVQHILSIERYSNPIYDDNYGVELEQYKSKSFEYLRASIETTLNDALTQDDRITGVTVNDVVQQEIDSVLITFTVNTIYGALEEQNVI